MEARPPQGPIQLGFDGLLSFLGIKGVGGTPHSLSGFTSATLDIEKFLLNRPRKIAAGTVTLVADTDEAWLDMGVGSPPVGEAWLVTNVTGNLEVYPPAEELRGLGIARRSNNGTPLDITEFATGPFTVMTAAAKATARANVVKPFILQSGEELGLAVSGFEHNGALDSVATLYVEHIVLTV